MKAFASIVAVGGFALCSGAAWYAAQFGATQIETQGREAMGAALSSAGQDWVEVQADGLRISLAGEAPSEAARFRALDVAEAMLPADRITDRMSLADALVAPPPPIALDILLAPDLVTLLGSVPESFDLQMQGLTDILQRRIVDLTQKVETVPEADWAQTLALLGEITPQIATGRLEISDGQMMIQAALPDAELRQKLLAEIEAGAPQGQALDLALNAPRMTLSPYPFDIAIREGVFEMGVCAAATEQDARTIIRQLASITGLTGLNCDVALGVPDENWLDTVQLAVETLLDLPDASISLRDRVMRLEVAPDYNAARLENITQRTRDRLPAGYSLLVGEEQQTVEPAPEPVPVAKGLTLTITAARFSAVGGVAGEAGVETLRSYAATTFPGRELSLDLIAGLPGAAPALADALVLTELLARLDTGTVRVTDQQILVTGTGAGDTLDADLEALLAQRLLEARALDVTVEGYAVAETAVRGVQPVLLSAAQCDSAVADAQAEQRITFAPGSATVERISGPTLDAIARVVATCPTAQIAIEGYTDSSGGEEMNQRISQDRADAVLDALLARGVFLDRMSATGFGEANPIANNGTTAGREANRRIAFTITDTATDQPAPNQEEDSQ